QDVSSNSIRRFAITTTRPSRAPTPVVLTEPVPRPVARQPTEQPTERLQALQRVALGASTSARENATCTGAARYWTTRIYVGANTYSRWALDCGSASVICQRRKRSAGPLPALSRLADRHLIKCLSIAATAPVNIGRQVRSTP